MQIDFVSLQALLAVAETKNFRAASEQLNLSISSVSRRIGELEADFGQRLFTRHSRGVELTEAGRVLVSRTRETFTSIDKLKAEMDLMKTGEIGQITICANGSALVNGLAEDLRAFMDDFPKVDIDLREELTPDVLSKVDRGIADIGFISNTMRAPETVTLHPYLEDRLVLVVSRDHPMAKRNEVDFGDLVACEVIGVQADSSLSRLIHEVGAMAKANFSYSYMASTNEVARVMVANRLGVAILPERFVLPYCDLLQIAAIPIAETWAKREIAIVLRGDGSASGAARAFFQWLEARRG